MIDQTKPIIRHLWLQDTKRSPARLVPEVVNSGCTGCHVTKHRDGSCHVFAAGNHLCRTRSAIWIEDTPESIAAYVAAKMEGA